MKDEPALSPTGIISQLPKFNFEPSHR